MAYARQHDLLLPVFDVVLLLPQKPHPPSAPFSLGAWPPWAPCRPPLIATIHLLPPAIAHHPPAASILATAWPPTAPPAAMAQPPAAPTVLPAAPVLLPSAAISAPATSYHPNRWAGNHPATVHIPFDPILPSAAPLAIKVQEGTAPWNWLKEASWLEGLSCNRGPASRRAFFAGCLTASGDVRVGGKGGLV